jgi:hypothetical protein
VKQSFAAALYTPAIPPLAGEKGDCEAWLSSYEIKTKSLQQEE